MRVKIKLDTQAIAKTRAAVARLKEKLHAAHRRQLSNHVARVIRLDPHAADGKRWREDSRGRCMCCGYGENGNSTGQMGSRRFVSSWFVPLAPRAQHVGSLFTSDPICAVCTIESIEGVAQQAVCP